MQNEEYALMRSITKQSRLKSKLAWTSTIALVVFVLKTYFDIEIKEIDKLVDLILLTFSAWGVWNNPEKSDNF